MPNAAIMLCAGKGKRMRGTVTDKILTPVAGLPLLCHSVNAFLQADVVDQFTFVYRDDEQRVEIAEAINECELQNKKIEWVSGGGERQDSVFNALAGLSLLIDYVFIHDCARPLIKPENLKELRSKVEQDKAAVLAHRVSDTIKKANNTKTQTRLRTLKDVPRANLWAMETPQAFERELITDAYRRIRFDSDFVTDDTAAASREGHKVTLVENNSPNPKLTTPADLAYIEFLLQ